MGFKEAKETYQQLFDSQEIKAKAFDAIAEKCYYANFGSTNKTDMDTLLFSLYLERILERDPQDFNAYSDYRLSKLLGISQTKVSNLKIKKELLYPYERFNWRDSLTKISDRAIFEDGRIKLFIPDKNLYLEIKNAIEENGGFTEAQLTQNLLQVRLPYFLDLLVAISDEDKDELRKKIKAIISENNKDITLDEKESLGAMLKRKAPEIIIDIIADCIPSFASTPLKAIATNVLKCVRETNS